MLGWGGPGACLPVQKGPVTCTSQASSSYSHFSTPCSHLQMRSVRLLAPLPDRTLHQQARGQHVVCLAAGSSSGAGAGGSFSRRGSRSERKARQPGLFEVKVITPPPRSLGIYALPPNTHNGEQIEIDGEGYVVTSLVLQYKLVKGKYVREHNRLEVQATSRYFLNMMLDDLVQARYVGPTGSQD